MLISTIQELMKYVQVSRDLSIISVNPSIRKAEQRNIIPLLGQEFYDQLHTAYEGGTLTPKEQQLLACIQAALAQLAMWNYVQFGGVSIDNSGIYKPKNDQRWNLGDSEQKKLENSYLSDGLDSLDDLMNFLAANLLSFPEYATSPEYLAERRSLVPSATVVQTLFTVLHPRVTFRALRESVRYFENGRFKKIMQGYYDHLLDKKDSELDPDDLELRVQARTALIYLAVSRAMITRTVKLTIEGIDVIMGGTTVSEPENKRIEAAARTYENSGEAELQSLVSLLNEKAPTGYVPPVITVDPDICEDKGGLAFF